MNVLDYGYIFGCTHLSEHMDLQFDYLTVYTFTSYTMKLQANVSGIDIYILMYILPVHMIYFKNAS